MDSCMGEVHGEGKGRGENYIVLHQQANSLAIGVLGVLLVIKDATGLKSDDAYSLSTNILNR